MIVRFIVFGMCISTVLTLISLVGSGFSFGNFFVYYNVYYEDVVKRQALLIFLSAVSLSIWYERKKGR